jgi:hypothetical protein
VKLKWLRAYPALESTNAVFVENRRCSVFIYSFCTKFNCSSFDLEEVGGEGEAVMEMRPPVPQLNLTSQIGCYLYRIVINSVLLPFA